MHVGWSVALALTVVSVPAQNPSVLGIAPGQEGRGVVIRAVLEGSPAAKAGLEVGDAVLMIDEALVRTPQDVRAQLYGKSTEGTMRLIVEGRKGKRGVLVAPVSWEDAKRLAPFGGKTLEKGKPAPALAAEVWDLAEGVEEPPVGRRVAGKVQVRLLYQATCPFCRRRGFPAHVAAERAFADRDDVVFMNVHAVAEGHAVNTFRKGVEVARAAGSSAPVAQDATLDGFGWSESWRRLRPAWTPWTVIVGPDGKIVYNGDTPPAKELTMLIEQAR